MATTPLCRRLRCVMAAAGPRALTVVMAVRRASCLCDFS